VAALRLPLQNDSMPGKKNNLCSEAEAHNVPFENFQSLGGIINVEAEGFFKREIS